MRGQIRSLITASCVAALCWVGLAANLSPSRAADLVQTELPGVKYIGNTDSTVPDPAHASANSVAASSVGSVSLDGVLSAYTSLGSGITFVTDALGHLLRVTDSLGRSANLNLTSSTPVSTVNVNGVTTAYQYDTNQRLVQTQQSTPGHVTQYQYDTSSRLVGATDPAGRTITYQYDPGNNRLSTATEPGPRTTQYQYDTNYRPSNVTDQNGAVTTTVYDSSDRLVSTDRSGNVTTYTYDGASDRIQTLTDPAGNVTTYFYDTGDRLIKEETMPSGATTQFFYDTSDRLIKRVDPSSAITTYTYDSANRLIKLEGPGSTITTYSYDSAGRLSSVGDAGGGSMTLTYVPELSSCIVWAGVAATMALRSGRRRG